MSDRPPPKPHHGMSLAAAFDFAIKHGCVCRSAKDGELLVIFPGDTKPVVVNRRRRDTPRCLTVRLTRLWESKYEPKCASGAKGL